MMLPLPPFESVAELVWFFGLLTVLSHALVLAVVYFSPVFTDGERDLSESEWKYGPTEFDDDG